MATKVTPPQPVLFGCIGESAAGVLSELRGLAREESVRIRGPFGAVVFRGEEGDEIVVQSETLDELYVAERSPSPFARSDPPRRASDSEALTRREITRVLRKLRTQRTGLHRGGSPRTPLVGYIVVDLSDLESDAGEDRPSPFRVEHVPRLGRWLRESAPEIDLTLVLLTGRTAETGDDPTEPWFRAFSALMKELQEDAPIQRLYIVDGRDQHGGWVATPTELKRNAAEFIFHHGLSPYRDQLRSREERRISLDEDFLESCGTFATRSLDFEPDSIERQVAKHLADTHLDPLRRESLVGAEPKEIRRAAERAAEEIAEVHFSSSESEEDKEKKLKRILTTHLREICRERPAAKLEAFLAELRPLLARMAIDDELSERFEERYRAAHILEKQHEATYSRFLEWSKLPYRIAYDNGDRYSPRLAERPHVEVSAPPSPVWTRTGAGLLAIGLVAVAFGALGFGAFFAIAGGLLAIIGSGVIDLPVARESYEPAVYERGQPPGDVEPVEYRRKPTGPVLWIGSCLVAIGAYSALWALAPMIRVEILHPSYVPLYYIGSILFLLLGFGLSWVRRDELPFRSPELESMDSGPTVPWRLSAMGAFAIGWLALSTQLRDDAAITSSPSTLYLGCGLLALFAGVLLLRIRRPGRIKLTIEIPPRPMPLETGYHEIPSDEARAPQSRAIVEKILPWIDDLLEGDEASDEIRAWPEPRPRESVLDVLVVSYRERLAGLFREHLKRHRGTDITELAFQSDAWVDCLVSELNDPIPSPGDPVWLFAKHHFGRWLRERLARHGWGSLLDELKPEPGRLHAFVHRGLPLYWPPTRREPRTDFSVIAVGEELWDVIQPLASGESHHRMVPVKWQSPRALRAVRIVQGLRGGWLGYDELPRKVLAMEEDEARSTLE